MSKGIMSIFTLLFGSLALLYLGAGCGVGVTLCKQGQECAKGERCFESRCQEPSANGNKPPVSRAGRTQRVRKGDIVRLDGSASTDADLDHLTFLWSFGKRPSGSKSKLNNGTNAQASFVADTSGAYALKLTTTDSVGAVDISELIVKVNFPPQANAGGEQLVLPGARVVLRGDESNDLDRGDVLEYNWRILQKPKGSKAALLKADLVETSFIADVPGKYSVELQVRDGMEESIDVISIQVADPSKVIPNLDRLDPASGPTRSVSLVTLHGSGFIQGAKVFFGEQSISSIYRSSKRVVATLDLRKVKIGDYQIKLVNPKGKATRSLRFEVGQVPIPFIGSLVPATLNVEQSARVLIQGKGFVDGAQVVFHNKRVRTSYISSKQVAADISTVGLKVGSYSLLVENDKNRRSNSIQIKVTKALSKPFITRHILSPSAAETNKKYTYLRLYGRGLTNTTRVRINGVIYKGKVEVTHRLGQGYVTLPTFHTMGWSSTVHRFFLFNASAGKKLESDAHLIRFSDPDNPSIYSLRFYHKVGGVSHTGATETIYKYLEIRGQRFRSGVEVYIASKKYKHTIFRSSSKVIRIYEFNTKGMKVGRFSLYVRNIRGKKINTSNSTSFLIEDGRVPSVSSITSSNGSRILYVDQKYTFIRITGRHFTSEMKILLNGVVLKNASQLENDTVCYVYKFNTEQLQAGQHTLTLKNVIGGKTYTSRIFLLNLQDRRKPLLRSLRFSPSSQLYKGDKSRALLYGLNFFPETKVLLDGKLYKGIIQVLNSQIILPSFDTTSLSLGSHSLQLKNTIKGKPYLSNQQAFVLKVRPDPVIRSFYPQRILAKKSQRIQISGSFFSQLHQVLLDEKKHKSTYLSSYNIRLVLDAENLSAGLHKIQVINIDGKKSNVKTFEVFLDKAPLLWQITPNVLYLSQLTESFRRRVQVSFKGAFLQSGARILINNVVVGSLSVSSLNKGQVGRASLNLSRFAGMDKVSVSIQNPGGKISNSSELWMHQARRPMILSTSFSPFLKGRQSYVLVRGNNFSLKSLLFINNKQYFFRFSFGLPGVASEQLRVTIPASQMLSDSYLFKIVNVDQSESLDYHASIRTSAAPYLLSLSPQALPDLMPKTGLKVLVSGLRLTSSSKVLLNGKALPTTYIHSGSVSVLIPSTMKFKVGDYVQWTLKNGNSLSNTHVVSVTKDSYVHSPRPHVLKKSEKSITFTFGSETVNSFTFMEVFGKSFPVSRVGGKTFRVVFKEIPTNIKLGVHSFRLKNATGEYSQTLGLHVMP